MAALLDIVVVTYNSSLVIEPLLDSIPGALGEITANVVVVDNGSTDNTVDLLNKRGDCKVVVSTNLGYSAGINRGVREGSGAGQILILNPDVRLHEGSVAPLLEALRVPGTGIAVPRMLSDDGSLTLSLRREFTLLRGMGLSSAKSAALSLFVHEPEAYEHSHVVDWAEGAALMMTRECFDLLGGWDESFFLYAEEVDLSLRARDLGLATRYEPRSVVMHIGGGSGRNAKTFAMLAINGVRLYGKRHNRVATWCFYVLTVVGQFSWAVRTGDPVPRFVVAALLRPSLRPAELKCAPRQLPGW